MSGRPPLGLTPKRLWQAACVQKRILDIEAAKTRYQEAGKPVPTAWNVELFEHSMFLAGATISPAGQAGAA